jgi:hypothetical protein
MRHFNRLAAINCFLMAALACAQATPAAATADATHDAIRLQILSTSQMSKSDAALLSARDSDVAEAAQFSGYDLSGGGWIQNQVLCPNAPNHLIVHYLRLAPDGPVSLFTAIIPYRQGRVRIIPVLYHGAPAFHVFGSLPGQRELINEVISTKAVAGTVDADSDWTTLAFCYAALVGAEPMSRSVTTPEETSPRLSISSDGKVQEMSFSVLGPERLRQEWRVLFDKHTQVKLIELSAGALQTPRAIPESQTKMQPIPAPK